MRTTITLDDDLMQELCKQAHKGNLRLKEVINSTIRYGLKAGFESGQSERYVCPVFSLGNPFSYNLDRALDLGEHLESEEITRKRLLRK
jgi:hypothetical protein